MADLERIDTDPRVLGGKPTIKGKRIAVEFVLDLLAQGWSHAQIAEQYPNIGEDDILACLRFASQTLKSERIYPLERPA